MNSKPEGRKDDQGKAPLILLAPFQDALGDIARVRAYGIEKYKEPDNWSGVEPGRYMSAAIRHIYAAARGGPFAHDPESKLRHLGHAGCSILMAMENERSVTTPLDVTRIGSLTLNFPDIEVWEMPETCALDVADRGGVTLERVGELINLTRERVRQIEQKPWAKLRRVLQGQKE